jgi:tripartite-type tricarboxylate transporter receptor subunit TctC
MKSVATTFGILPAAIALGIAGAPAKAQSVADFYSGKSIALAIGFAPGGGYDLYGRLVARHLGKHIPGNPQIVPQNMPGAGSMRAAQHLYSVAPKDGTAIATFGRQMGITPLLNPAAKYDGTKFTWLGSITNEVSTCVTWHTSPVKTWNDLLTKPVTFSGDGPGADPDVFANLYNNVFGTKIKIISGYRGTNPMIIAMERGEVEGLCGLSWSTITCWCRRRCRRKRTSATCRWRSTWPRPRSSGRCSRCSCTARRWRGRSRPRPAYRPTARRL